MSEKALDPFTGVFLPTVAQDLESAADSLEALLNDDDGADFYLASALRAIAKKHMEAAATGSLDQVYREWFAHEVTGPTFEQRLRERADRLRDEEWRIE